MLRYSTVYGNYRNIRKKIVSTVFNFGASTILISASMGSSLSLLVSQQVFAASPANQYVSTTGNNSGNCDTKATPCQTISYALSQADNGTVIHVAAGAYPEMLTITKSVVIEGAGQNTQITVPGTTASGKVVDINAPNVTLEDLSVTGPFAEGCNDNEYGVYFENNASGSIRNSWVTNIETDAADFGCQQGIAVRVGQQSAGISANATLTNDVISGYQKGGIVVDGAGSSATITGTTVTGAGITGAIAQNGIQVSRGATATIEHDTVTGNSYNDAAVATAAGVLLYGAGDHTVVESDTITNNQIGYYTEDQANLKYLSLTGVTGNTRNAIAWTTGDYTSAWPTPTTTYADAGITGQSDNVYGSDIVETQGTLQVWGYNAFTTVQGAMNAVAANGRVNVANGTYNEDLSIPKEGLKVYGQSQNGVNVDSTGGYGIDIENQNGTQLSNMTVNSPNVKGYALHAYQVSGLTLNNMTFNGPGKSSSVGGVDVNSSQNVAYNNVSVSNYGKNGFSVTAKYAAADDYSRNITFNNITASDNAWDGIAFYTTNSSGVDGHSITGVHFNGTNTITNNGKGSPTQGGIFLEGDNDGSAFGCWFPIAPSCTPRYTITTAGKTLQLGNTNFNGNTSDIWNFQTGGVNALNATFAGKTGDQMTTSERSAEDGLIFDHLDRNPLGLVQYYDEPTVPTNGQPNGGFEKTNDFYFTWDASNGNGPLTYEYQTSMNPASSNGVLTTNIWDNIANGNSEQKNLTSPQIHSVGAPDGTWYWQVRAIDTNGHMSAWSPIWSVTIDTHAPTGLANESPANGTFTTTANLTQINWTAATDPNGPVTYFYESSLSSATNADGSFSNPVYQSGALNTNNINTSGTPAGTYYWHVRAVDAAGNSTPWTDAWKVTVDNTPPEVPTAALKDSNGKNITNGDINTLHFTFNLSDTSNDVARYQLKYWNSIPGSPFNGESNAWNPTDLSAYSSSLGVYNDQFTQGEGTHFFAFSACDAAGNCSAYSTPFTVVYDKTAPTVSIVKPTDFSKPFSVGPTVTVSASDSGSGLQSLVTHVYDSANALLPVCGSATAAELLAGEMNCNLSSLPNGTYYIKAGAFDNAGNNTTVTSATFTISAPPTVFNTAFTTLHPTNTGSGNNNGTPSDPTQSQGSNTDPNTPSNNNGNGHVLGDSTTTPSTVIASGNKPSGTKNVSASTSFLSLAWYWWVLIVLAVLAFIYAIYQRANVDSKNTK